MTVLVDTNVLLDVLLDRKPFADASTAVWTALETSLADGVVAAVSFHNIFYIVSKELNRERAHQAVRLVFDSFAVAAVDRDTLSVALVTECPDFEDAIQAVAAHRAGATHVVTRDPRGFDGGPLIVLSPEQFLAAAASGA